MLDTNKPKPRSTIRDALEDMAWKQNPKLARRLKNHRDHTTPKWQESSRRIMRWQDRVLLALSGLLLMLLVIRAETVNADETWGLQLKTSGGTHTEMAINSSVEMDITGLMARVSITQQFTNNGMEWAEGTYRFPLPEGAAVDQMIIKVGDRLLEGEIQEKATARRTYEKARQAGKTTTLVEQQRRNQFETRLANIGPGESIDVTISYLQSVEYRDLGYHLRLPMTFTPRWQPPQSMAQMLDGDISPVPELVSQPSGNSHRLSLSASIVSPIELASIESRYHDVDIRQVENGYRVELLHDSELSDRDFELSWSPTLQSHPEAFLTTYNSGDAVYAQLMVVPPLNDAIQAIAREVILVIDTSGSMQGASMTQAKAALTHALKSLGPDDHFNLLQFNSSTEQLFDQSVPVSRANLYSARDFIEGLSANGGTDMAPALEEALLMPVQPGLMRQVIFITDGAVGNETQLLKQVANDLNDSRMFTVAIGHAPNSWFMRKTAEIGRGSYVQIAKPEEVEEQMSALWQRIQTPALTDICVNWGDSAEYFPEVVPDLYAGEPLWLLARLPSQPTIISLCGTLDGQDWDFNINGWDATDTGEGGDNLAKLWARKKIESLEDGLLFGADRELTQLEITDVALQFGLLTRFTSLVAVDKTPRRPVDETLASSNIPGLLPAGSSQELAAFPNTATGWLAQLLLSLLVLSVATSMLLFSGSRLPSFNIRLRLLRHVRAH